MAAQPWLLWAPCPVHEAALSTEDTLLTGENAAFLDLQYTAWLADPSSVGADWRKLFESWDRPTNGAVPRLPEPRARSIFAGGSPVVVQAEPNLDAARRQAKVVALVNAYRVRGHMAADIDPLGLAGRVGSPELDPAFFDLTEAELDQPVASRPIYGEPEVSTPRRILDRLRRAYCGSIGAEFMNIQDIVQRRWVQERLETLPERRVLDKDAARRMLRKLSDAESFERMLHNRFPGTKRFSIEGGETLVPLLDQLLAEAGAHGVKEIVLGMAHRGRLNVLANFMGKPVHEIVKEFQDVKAGSFQGSGDVKYHLGYSNDATTSRGDVVHLSLTPNPSHLEAVDPVVEGRVRAKQDRAGDTDRVVAMPVLLHGDAAFAGQGLVAEVLNLSDLKGYRTGGTIHVVVNNQIGFTTAPLESRSTPYATDVARMLAIPIFHVNGEDPEAVAAVTRMAVEWRQTFHRDVVVDMYCFRKHGHNEGDEPSFTQPLMYDEIRKRPTPREMCARRLVASGLVAEAEVSAILNESRDAIDRQSESPAEPPVSKSPLKDLWAEWGQQTGATEIDTTWPVEKLRELLIRANTLPEGLKAHNKVQRVLAQRLEMIRGERPMDWAVGEQAAYATLVTEGVRVRVSGQDSGRGTFTHRHAVITDVETEAEYFPLQHLAPDQAPFHVIDSSLSEAGVLGFEFGYSWDYPDALVIWEAQFGDFANGAQVIIDQFIAAAEQKWNRYSGLVMFLPHGYEGQGPEHSSARLERFLQLCAEDNMQVANVTTPANIYHLLRRQALRKLRKPLVVMTPKSLLRHQDAVSTVEELANGRFQRVIPEIEPLDPAQVKRVVLCSGKVYYDLLAERRKRNEQRVALVRVEQLYPFPADAIREALAPFQRESEILWCQEEPRNMGAWPMFDEWLEEATEGRPRYVGRKASASPATGSQKKHAAEHEKLLSEALSL
jgi:2-oxoglutarate dehydrogenase E1 component